jgi:hypothetical protein
VNEIQKGQLSFPHLFLLSNMEIILSQTTWIWTDVIWDYLQVLRTDEEAGDAKD